MPRNLLLEAEIEATKHLLAESDAMSELTGDFTEGDAHMQRLLDLGVQAGLIPQPRQP